VSVERAEDDGPSPAERRDKLASATGDADADEFLEVSGRMARLADGYENAFGTSQTSGALRRASRMLAQATKYLPRRDRCRLPGCNERVEQPAVGRRQEFCSDKHRHAHWRKFGKPKRRVE
jgi:hypothetical protein